MYTLACCDVFGLLSMHEKSNMPASLGRGDGWRLSTQDDALGPVDKLCHSPVSSEALKGGCSRSTSLTDVEF